MSEGAAHAMCACTVCRLHSIGMHWVPILDAAVKRAPGYSLWDEGEAQGLFMRDGNPSPGA